MSLTVIILSAVLLLVLSQFGKRVSARNTFIWWASAIFLFLATIHPEWFSSLSEMFGFQLVSNFIFAAMIFFLFVQLFDVNAEATSNYHRSRKIVCGLAARAFEPNWSKMPSALVIVPCYNEEEVLPVTIQKLRALETQTNGAISFCIVDDGSSDRSLTIAKQSCPENVASHVANIGVAGVLMTGFMIAKKLDVNFVVQCDADGQHPIDKISDLVRHADSQKTDLLIGSRFLNPQGESGSALASTTWTRWLGSRVLQVALLMFGRRAAVSDPTSGLRVYSRQAVKNLVTSLPDDYPEPEVVALIASADLTIGEIQVDMYARAGGESSITTFKSIRYMAKILSALAGLRLRTLWLSK